MRRYTIEAKEKLSKLAKELVPYVHGVHTCSRDEAILMVSIVYTAILHKMLNTGFAKLPVGTLSFTVSPKDTNPLRTRLYSSAELSKFFSTGEAKPQAVQECLLPEHYQLLSNLQAKAFEYKEEKYQEHLKKTEGLELVEKYQEHLKKTEGLELVEKS